MAENTALACPERKRKYPLFVFFEDARSVFKLDDLGLEILRIAFPAALALAADPIASLIDTAFIGHLGSVEIAAVGVSIAIFNQASKVAIFPIVNITTSFVAEEDTVKRIASESEKCGDLEKGAVKINVTEEMEPEETAVKNLDASIPEVKTKEFEEEYESCKTTAIMSNSAAKSKVKRERRQIPSASTALAIGAVLGLLQTLLLIFLAKPLLGFMGVKAGSAMLAPARKYLTLRALGSPAVALSLAMQGVFRGFKDTKTPLYATVAGDTTNIILDPIFIFVCHLGVSGAAIAHVLSQYLISIILLCKLMKQVDLLPPTTKHMQFSKFLKSGFLILARVLAATICVTLAASKAARLGATPMAAFQVCLQVWLTSSLLSDGLAVAGQAILACAFAEKDYEKATAAARRVIQFVAGTQPINSLAFVFDGINYGSFDFAYSAYSMVMVAAASIGCLFLLSKVYGFIGIWIALSIYMMLRASAGFWRVCSGTGPWRYLRGKTSSEDTDSAVSESS
ncbi:OLC1v1001523C1 [Oldenlandia corymbosa var. corymbosa]|uniref:Protein DETOXIFICATION n=1 Tax=Oldenlandia corymbosa var. corymbosa TaxID=529605 RepID=A0AAV1D7Z5_OLDCO|nr:OLC1v1001523C1 [Oldenlandia corymbosa var. corymbosa]